MAAGARADVEQSKERGLGTVGEVTQAVGEHWCSRRVVGRNWMEGGGGPVYGRGAEVGVLGRGGTMGSSRRQ